MLFKSKRQFSTGDYSQNTFKQETADGRKILLNQLSDKSIKYTFQKFSFKCSQKSINISYS